MVESERERTDGLYSREAFTGQTSGVFVKLLLVKPAGSS